MCDALRTFQATQALQSTDYREEKRMRAYDDESAALLSSDTVHSPAIKAC